MIRLREDIVFEDPQTRIREYCDIEVYQGYDDRHSINNLLSKEDIAAANNLYAMIDRYDSGESERLLEYSEKLSNLLAMVPNKDLLVVSSEEWSELKEKIGRLIGEFVSVRGIGLAKATKILHLKRPNLFPVLDSFFVDFLLNIKISTVEKSNQVDVAIQALDMVRSTLIEQKDAFRRLVEQTRDLPISLTMVRMFDILCWTAEKWDIRGIHKAPRGIPHKSLLKTIKSEKHDSQAREQRTKGSKYVVFEDLERANSPKLHRANCFYYKRWLGNPTSTTKWHGPFETEEKGWEICKEISHGSGLVPSKHRCVEE